MRQCSSSVSGSACARQCTGIRERLLSGSKGPITMFSKHVVTNKQFSEITKGNQNDQNLVRGIL